MALHGVPAELLVLEVTETALMTDPSKAQGVLEELADLGVGISIDDFGAGYTSLGHLTTMPISELKIDRAFVDAMTRDRRSAQVVQSIITLGHNLGLTIVAEGVETEQALTMLADLGCDSAQGYHLSRPLPAAAFDIWAESKRSPLTVFEPTPS
jgi:EAL domain-containing protein (putative c-di-GMP-specific phosphodiesterase class I)